jgi:hypothetical protein
MKGNYREVDYIVTTGPVDALVAYIKIPEGHPWNKLVDKVSTFKIGEHEITVHNGYDDIPLDVHGGLTFSHRTNGEEWPQGFDAGAWIGWDYAHCGDYVPRIGSYGERHSVESVEYEVKAAIDSMLEYQEQKQSVLQSLP